MLNYHVYDGRNWLQDDERSWAPDYHGAASFNYEHVAREIAEREGADRVVYVFGLLPS